jgi:hypothetical protein
MLVLTWITTLALAADAPKDLCDGKIGAEQLDCIQAHYPADFKSVEAVCEDPANAPRRTCRVTRYATVGIAFVGNPERGDGEGGDAGDHPTINRSALTAAATTLGVAGKGLQLLPSICSLANTCKLNKKDKSLIASFSQVVTGVSDKVPVILESSDSDTDKASKLLGLAARLEAGIPTGLSSSAQGAVQPTVTAVREFLPVLVSLGHKRK